MKRPLFIILLLMLLLPPLLLMGGSEEAGAVQSSTQVSNLPPEFQNVKVKVRGDELNILVTISDYNSYYDISKVTVDILDINGEFVNGFEYQQVFTDLGPRFKPLREDVFRNTRGNILLVDKCSALIEQYPVDYVERNTITVNFVFKPINGVEIIIKGFDQHQESSIIMVQYAASWFGTSTGDPRVDIAGQADMYTSNLYSISIAVVFTAVAIQARLHSNKWAKKLEALERIEVSRYYTMSLITLSFFTFLGTFMAAKFILIFLLMSGFTPEFVTYLSPLVLFRDIRDFQLAVASAGIAVVNAVLHFKHNEQRLMISMVLTMLMIGGIGGAIYMFSYDVEANSAMTWGLLFTLVTMLMIDNQSFINYPSVLERLKHNYCTKCRFLWRVAQKQRYFVMKKMGFPGAGSQGPNVTGDLGALRKEFDLEDVKDRDISDVMKNVEPNLSRQPMKVKLYKSGIVIEQDAILEVGLNAIRSYVSRFDNLGISNVELSGLNIKSITLTRGGGAEGSGDSGSSESIVEALGKKKSEEKSVTGEAKEEQEKDMNDIFSEIEALSGLDDDEL